MGGCAQGVAFAKAYAVKNGPIVLEMDTYRYHGHSMSDPGSTYRTRDEIAAMRQQRDPIEHVRKLLLEHAGVEAAELKKIEKARAHVRYQAVECQMQRYRRCVVCVCDEGSMRALRMVDIAHCAWSG